MCEDYPQISRVAVVDAYVGMVVSDPLIRASCLQTLELKLGAAGVVVINFERILPIAGLRVRRVGPDLVHYFHLGRIINIAPRIINRSCGARAIHDLEHRIREDGRWALDLHATCVRAVSPDPPDQVNLLAVPWVHRVVALHGHHVVSLVVVRQLLDLLNDCPVLDSGCVIRIRLKNFLANGIRVQELLVSVSLIVDRFWLTGVSKRTITGDVICVNYTEWLIERELVPDMSAIHPVKYLGAKIHRGLCIVNGDTVTTFDLDSSVCKVAQQIEVVLDAKLHLNCCCLHIRVD